MAFSFGIVGSRRRKSLRDIRICNAIVDRVISQHPGEDLTFCSGGAEGPDTFGAQAASSRNISMIRLFLIPRDPPITSKWEFTQRAFARNRLIVEASEEVYCLVHPSRTGGTENTIQHALDLQKKVFLVTETGEVYLSPDGKIPTCAPVVHLLDSKSTG
jgi:predicted Rossmann fold nucleotide-binding protein DprA/Smf involved in DNA uptake